MATKNKPNRKLSGVNVENWKGKKVYVARLNNKITSWKYVKGSRTTLETLRNRFHKTKTLTEGIQKREITQNKLILTKSNITSKINIKNKLSNQIGVKVTWYKKGQRLGVTYGYSQNNLMGELGKGSAFFHAFRKAVNRELFKYDEKGITEDKEYFKFTISKRK